MPGQGYNLLAASDHNDDGKVADVPPHWMPSKSPVLELVFTVLCISAVGHATLEYSWREAHLSEEAFTKHKDCISSRMTQIAFVATFLLSSIAVLVTTVPAKDAILNYCLHI
ncbi:hypothetical protein C8R45DRAFT_1089381 [Mycena sanguinolenta]|nr:hypothetical protein C8R45DRAFT_1089381 [Mycena sanguinolenta]